MRLLRVYSNMDSFKTVPFNETGLSFIVAKQKNPESNDKGKTYNGVGKSLLARIIHFCLGGKASNYTKFCKNLPNWEFYLDYIIDDTLYTAKRTTNNPNTIVLNGEELSINKFTSKMQSLCFDIPENTLFLTFRSLLPFFIRPHKKSYVLYSIPGSDKTDYQILINNGFLLGLDVSLIQNKHLLRKEQVRIEKLEGNFKKDSLLKDFLTGNRDATLTLVDIEERIKNLDQRLSEFKVAEDYTNVQEDADFVENKLFTLKNDIVLLENNIQNIDNSLDCSPDVSKDNIKSIYEESNVFFSDSLLKTLDELEVFYEKLMSNRKRRLAEQKNKLVIEKQDKESELEKLQKKLDEIMQYLGDHQAFDLFLKLSEKSAKLKAERDKLLEYQGLQAEYKIKLREIEKEFINLSEIADEYLVKIESDIAILRDYFRKIAKVFYPDSVAGLTVESNSGENQLLFSIDAKIESDGSDGINNVKIFCYDLTLLFKGHNHHFDFVFHDSRLFDGTDERQKSDMFKIIKEQFTDSNKQYIASVNQNQLDEINRHLEPEEFHEIISNNTVLTLTDESDEDKLLGIKVDLRED